MVVKKVKHLIHGTQCTYSKKYAHAQLFTPMIFIT